MMKGKKRRGWDIYTTGDTLVTVLLATYYDYFIEERKHRERGIGS